MFVLLYKARIHSQTAHKVLAFTFLRLKGVVCEATHQLQCKLDSYLNLLPINKKKCCTGDMDAYIHGMPICMGTYSYYPDYGILLMITIENIHDTTLYQLLQEHVDLLKPIQAYWPCNSYIAIHVTLRINTHNITLCKLLILLGAH